MSYIRIDDILDHLDNVTGSGTQWSARCPAHDDNRNSLSVGVGTDGKVLMHCHAGCSFEDVLKALDLPKKTVLSPRQKKGQPKKVVAVYNYVDEAGELLYQVLRYEPKSFSQRRSDSEGDWTYKLDGVRRVLYRLPQVVEAVARNRRVFIVEGEKDCDRLVAEGLDATTNSGGASKWQEEFSAVLIGARVVIIPDNDGVGKAHAEKIAADLQTKADSVKVVELPNLPPKGDVSDFLDAGGTIGQLVQLCEQTEEWKPKAASGSSGGRLQTVINLTDIGNAVRFVEMHGVDVRYCYDAGKWLVWRGNRWSFDEDGEIIRRAKETATAMCQLVGSDIPENQSEEAKWARQSASASRLKSMVTLAESEPGVPVALADLDANDWVLNTLNGTVDLKTGELRPHSKDDLITKLAHVYYDPNAKSVVFDDFLERVLPDSELRAFVQRAAGYTLTGSVAEEVLFFAYGPPASGKTTLLESLASAMGEYAVTASFKTFVKSNSSGSGATSDVARLAGRRLVKSSEVEKGDAFSESLIKQLTGGDTITARFLYREFFEFRPRFKLWIAGNDRPRARDDDDALWRRICQLPFEQSIPAGERDPSIKAQLQNPAICGSAILAWAVNGCLDYQRNGLGIPEAVKKATLEYREEMDPLAEFLDECCVEDSRRQVNNSDLWEAYQHWSKDVGLRYPLSQKSLSKRLSAKGFISNRSSHARYWTGLGLKVSIDTRVVSHDADIISNPLF